MEIKTLLQACHYAPDKVAEFIINFYLESSSDCKAEIEAKFQSYFTNGGSLLPEPKTAK